MILDQANELRELVRKVDAVSVVHSDRKTATILVIGGKGGVGTTTLSVNLAVALSQRCGRTILAEATSPGGNIDLLCANKTIAMPVDLRIIATKDSTKLCGHYRGTMHSMVAMVDELGTVACSASDARSFEERLFGKIIRQEVHTDIVVVDGGNHLNQLWQSLASTADIVLVATTADPASIVGSHAAIKMLRKTTKIEKLYTIVNQINRASTAEEVHRRLHRACRRFLAINLHHAGYVTHDQHVNAAARNGQPFMLSSPTCRASRQVRALADNVVKKIGESIEWNENVRCKMARAA
jgi:flagellar biosynthesis protein FlhG